MDIKDIIKWFIHCLQIYCGCDYILSHKTKSVSLRSSIFIFCIVFICTTKVSSHNITSHNEISEVLKNNDGVEISNANVSIYFKNNQFGSGRAIVKKTNSKIDNQSVKDPGFWQFLSESWNGFVEDDADEGVLKQGVLKKKTNNTMDKKSVKVKDHGFWQFLSDIWHGFVEDDERVLKQKVLMKKTNNTVDKKSVKVKDPGFWQFLSDIWHGLVEDDVDKEVLKQKLMIQFSFVTSNPDAKQDAEDKEMTGSKFNLEIYNALKNLTALIEFSSAFTKEFNEALSVYDSDATSFILKNWGGPLQGKNNTEKFQSLLEASARTFARPWKKMAMMLIPLVFHSGATSMFIAVTAIGMLKMFLLLLINGVATSVSLIAGLRRGGHNTSEIGLDGRPISVHIHNQLPSEHHSPYVEHTAPAYFHETSPPHGPHYHSSPYGATSYHSSPYGVSSYHSTPYQRVAYHDSGSGTGPHTINTPYGQYVKVGPPSKELY